MDVFRVKNFLRVVQLQAHTNMECCGFYNSTQEKNKFLSTHIIHRLFIFSSSCEK